MNLPLSSCIIILLSLLLTSCFTSPEKTPLMQAAAQGDLQKIQPLLQHGNDINARNAIGFDALLYAIKFNRAEVVRFLLEHGANPDSADNRGTTAFIMAAAVGNLETIKMLHDHGAPTDQATLQLLK